jgi:hypothetical protein
MCARPDKKPWSIAIEDGLLCRLCYAVCHVVLDHDILYILELVHRDSVGIFFSSEVYANELR